MKAVCFTSFGKTTDALSIKTIPKPSVDTPGEVLIKVHASALNPIDKIRLSGDLSLVNPEKHDTSVLGYDVAGIVEEVGDEASKEYSIGDEVYVRLAGMKYGVSNVLSRCAYDIHGKLTNSFFGLLFRPWQNMLSLLLLSWQRNQRIYLLQRRHLFRW